MLAQVPGEKIASATGVDCIVAALDELFLKDSSQSGFAAFDDFIKYCRPASLNISDYLIEFNLKYNKIMAYDMKLPEGVLAYALLTCANLPADQERICRATVSRLTYQDMKSQIEKVVLSSDTSKPDCTVEAQFYAREQPLHHTMAPSQSVPDFEDTCPAYDEHDVEADAYYTQNPRNFRNQRPPPGYDS